MTPGQFLSHEPMRCRFESVKRAGSRKNERASANRGNTGATADGSAQPAKEFLGKGPVDVVDSGDNYGVGAFQRREPPGHPERHVLRLDLRLLATGPHLITRLPFNVPDVPEYFQWRREIAKDHTVECHNRNQVRLCGAAAAGWLKSCEECLFSHWSNYRAFLTIEAKERNYAYVSLPITCDGLPRPGD
jgi:hypothetical protein